MKQKGTRAKSFVDDTGFVRSVSRSFGFAIRGIVCVVRTERNFRIHLVFCVFLAIAGFVFHLSAVEWIAVSLSAGLVLFAETCNTAIEYLADSVSPHLDPGVGRAKDAAAGAVLIAVVAAVIVGLIVFLPHVWVLLRQWILPPG